MRCSLESLLDDNFGLIKVNSAFQVDDDHFGRVYDKVNEHSLHNYDLENQIKYLLFTKTRESNKHVLARQMQKQLDIANELFLAKHQFLDKSRIKQLIRNLLELLEQ